MDKVAICTQQARDIVGAGIVGAGGACTCATRGLPHWMLVWDDGEWHLESHPVTCTLDVKAETVFMMDRMR